MSTRGRGKSSTQSRNQRRYRAFQRELNGEQPSFYDRAAQRGDIHAADRYGQNPGEHYPPELNPEFFPDSFPGYTLPPGHAARLAQQRQQSQVAAPAQAQPESRQRASSASSQGSQPVKDGMNFLLYI